MGRCGLPLSCCRRSTCPRPRPSACSRVPWSCVENLGQCLKALPDLQTTTRWSAKESFVAIWTSRQHVLARLVFEPFYGRSLLAPNQPKRTTTLASASVVRGMTLRQQVVGRWSLTGIWKCNLGPSYIPSSTLCGPKKTKPHILEPHTLILKQLPLRSCSHPRIPKTVWVSLRKFYGTVTTVHCTCGPRSPSDTKLSM